MDVRELIPGLYFLRFPVGHVYLWCEDDGLTLIDSGLPGSAPAVAEAIRSVGRSPDEVRRVVLTHFHPDHAGGASEIAGWDGVEVCAHRLDTPFLRGERPGPPPDLADWERPLMAQVQAGFKDLPPGPPPGPVRVDRELSGAEVLDFAGGARIVEVGGHTPGSIALFLPEHGVLFAGDAAAARDEGTVTAGIFNADRDATARSFATLCALDADIACFGHGDPVVGGAARALRSAQ